MSEKPKDEKPIVANPGQVRDLIDSLRDALSKPVRITSGAPANITTQAMELENRQNQKNVDRKLAELLGYVRNQGFRSRVVKAGFNYSVTIWHHSEGTGHTNENPPASLKAPDAMGAAVTAENDALKARVESLERELAGQKARNKGGKDEPGVQSEGVSVEA